MHSKEVIKVHFKNEERRKKDTKARKITKTRGVLRMSNIIIKDQSGLSKIAEEIAGMQQMANVITKVDATNMSSATDMISVAKKLSRELDSKRAEQVKPYNDAVSAYNKKIKGVIGESNKVVEVIEPLYIAFINEQKRIEEERLRKQAEEEAEKLRKQAEEEAAHMEAVAVASDSVELLEMAEQVKSEAERSAQIIQNAECTAKIMNRSNLGSISNSEKWEADIKNKAEVLGYLIKLSDLGIDLLEGVTISKTTLNALANQTKKEGLFNGLLIKKVTKLNVR